MTKIYHVAKDDSQAYCGRNLSDIEHVGATVVSVAEAFEIDTDPTNRNELCIYCCNAFMSEEFPNGIHNY